MVLHMVFADCTAIDPIFLMSQNISLVIWGNVELLAYFFLPEGFLFLLNYKTEKFYFTILNYQIL